MRLCPLMIGLALIDVRDDIVPISLALIVYKRSGLDIGSTVKLSCVWIDMGLGNPYGVTTYELF